MRSFSIRGFATASALALLMTMPDAVCAAPSLESLAATRFQKLSAAESRMIRAAVLGETAWIGPSSREEDATNDPANAAQWGANRAIRSAVIRWLLMDPSAENLVSLYGLDVRGAAIDGALDLSGIKTDLPLRLRQCAIPGGISLADADVRLLDFRGSRTSRVDADGIVVRGAFLLSGGFHSDGSVRLTWARVGGLLSFRDATVVGDGDAAVVLTQARIDEDAFFSGFKTNKLVDISLTTVGGNVTFKGAQFDGDAWKSGVEAINTDVKGAFVWMDIGPKPSLARLDLTFAKVGGLADDKQSWPDSILVNEFVYDKFDDNGRTPRDLSSRLAWLSKQSDFRSQPYLQLARIFTAIGREDDARAVLIEKERQERRDAPVWSWFLRSTIGYGYAPMRAAYWSGTIILLGWLIFWYAYRLKLMVPSDRDGYESMARDGDLPAYYRGFNSLVYSFETLVPLVDLHQGRYWSPASLRKGEGDRRRRVFASFLRWYLRAQILSGWLLSTTVVAGLSGILNRG